MGMSTHIKGFVPPDAEYQRKLHAYRACQDAGVSPPEALQKFFNNEPPDEAGMTVELGAAVKRYSAEMQDGFEVDLSKLPPSVKTIRFYNSY